MESDTHVKYLCSKARLYASMLKGDGADPYTREYEMRLELGVQIASDISLRFTSKATIDELQDQWLLARTSDFVMLFKKVMNFDPASDYDEGKRFMEAVDAILFALFTEVAEHYGLGLDLGREPTETESIDEVTERGLEAVRQALEEGAGVRRWLP